MDVVVAVVVVVSALVVAFVVVVAVVDPLSAAVFQMFQSPSGAIIEDQRSV